MDTAGRVIEVDHYSGSAPPAPWLPSGQTAPSNTGTATVAYDQTLSGCTGPATKSTDEAGNVKYTCSDGLDRLISVTEPNATSGAAGTVTTYGYDSFGNITSVDATSGGTQEPTLSCGHMRCFAYSGPLSRLMSASNPESGTTTYQYDNNGNLLKRTDANGTIMTVAAYDGLNRPTGISAGSPAVTYVPGSVTTPSGTYNVAATPSVTYTYDAGFKGALSSVANSASTTSYAYDGFGRISGSTQTMGASGPSYTFGYKYSLTDTLNSMTYPSGRQVDYQLDSADRVTTVQNVTGGGDYASSIGYTPNSDLSGMTLGNGVTQNFTWNDRLQPTGMTATGGGATLLGLGFFPCSGGATSCATNAGAGTGNNGNLLSQTITMPVPGQPQNPLNLTQSYTYDHLNRITGAQETGGGANWSQAYGYDVLGNRWVSSNTGLPNLPLETPVASSWYSTTLPNRYAAWTYDNTGNVLQMGSVVNSFTYDAENRQVTACFNCAVGSPTGTYAYDGIGQRVSKTAGGQTTTYVYAAFGNVAAEYSTGAVTSACGTPTCYVTTDHLGSTRMLTSSAGAVGSRYDYQPFGLEIPAGYDGRTTGMGFLSTPDATNPKYTGQERDQETTLDNFLVRYYDPAQGRFQSPDPGNAGADPGNPQSWNGFGYVANNPLSLTDPSGMDAVVAGAGIGTAVCGPVCTGIGAGIGAIIDGLALWGIFGGGGPSTISPSLVTPSSPVLQTAVNLTNTALTTIGNFRSSPNCTGAVTAAGAAAGAGAGAQAGGDIGAAAGAGLGTLALPGGGTVGGGVVGFGVGGGIGAAVGYQAGRAVGGLAASVFCNSNTTGGSGGSTNHGNQRFGERNISRQDVDHAIESAKEAGQVTTKIGKYGTPQNIYNGTNGLTVVVETAGRNAGKVITAWWR